jgi:hypothetical protein
MSTMEDFHLSFPIDMIKKEERIIVGIATADNIDKTGDIVEFDASVEAFKNWQGNIREMHAPIAVGKAIKYEPIKVKDKDGNEYNAMKVEAYISKGAQDTWEKILDGTLRAFSIGGKILEKQIDSEKMHYGRPVSRIKKYTLGELSVVDNPANPVSTIDIVKFSESNDNLDYILKIDCQDIDLTIPESVKRAAQAGLSQRKQHGRGGTSVGLGSARRLAAGGKASPEFVRKVSRYFPRHEGYLKAKGGSPGEEGYPSNARIAWNLWGGTPGWVWARSKVRQLDNCTRKMDSSSGNICSCQSKDDEDYGIIEELSFMEKLIDSLEQEDLETAVAIVNETLQIEDNYANVTEMDTSAAEKLSLLKRFVNWLTAVDEEADVYKSVEIASTETNVEAESDHMEDQMDIDMLKDALGSVIDQKLTDFAASLKEEVEASVSSKIEEVTKSVALEKEELESKLAAAEKTLEEQNVKVEQLAAAGAMKKSVDPDEEDDDEELVKSTSDKSFWNNVYLPSGLVKSLGYSS